MKALYKSNFLTPTLSYRKSIVKADYLTYTLLDTIRNHQRFSTDSKCKYSDQSQLKLNIYAIAKYTLTQKPSTPLARETLPWFIPHIFYYTQRSVKSNQILRKLALASIILVCSNSDLRSWCSIVTVGKLPPAALSIALLQHTLRNYLQPSAQHHSILLSAYRDSCRASITVLLCKWNGRAFGFFIRLQRLGLVAARARLDFRAQDFELVLERLDQYLHRLGRAFCLFADKLAVRSASHSLCSGIEWNWRTVRLGKHTDSSR
ncbi:hypothetical protein EDC01DRAFT_416501 [Geopyxis carbonaria]|nr:hypothetical protein EDC01DRAFT_416501 [Geopyxis carbonaria]